MPDCLALSREFKYLAGRRKRIADWLPSEPGVPWQKSSNAAKFRHNVSLVVKLEDDLGEHSEWVVLHGLVPVGTGENYSLLSGIDPFGKTVFNHLQMDSFSKSVIKLELGG